MSSPLQAVFAVSLLLLLAGCGQKVRRDTSSGPPGPPAPLPDSIIGERVKGRVDVRERPGGAILFTLADSTLVSCGAPEGAWYPVGLYMALPAGEYGTDTLRKGRKVIVDGKAVGEMAKDLKVTISSTGSESWAELTGYVPKDRIYPFSIIEGALAGYMDTVKGRTVEALQPLIQSFRMEKDEELKPYVSYFTYESWIEDPSPLPRVQLVFRDEKLIGVVHTRSLKLPHTTDEKLERGFRVLFFSDTPAAVREDFARRFNSFITSVD